MSSLSSIALDFEKELARIDFVKQLEVIVVDLQAKFASKGVFPSFDKHPQLHQLGDQVAKVLYAVSPTLSIQSIEEPYWYSEPYKKFIMEIIRDIKLPIYGSEYKSFTSLLYYLGKNVPTSITSQLKEYIISRYQQMQTEFKNATKKSGGHSFNPNRSPYF